MTATSYAASTGHTLHCDTARDTLTIEGPAETMAMIPDAEIDAAAATVGRRVDWGLGPLNETSYRLVPTLRDPAVALALAYVDGREAALEFRADHTEEECTQEAEDGSEPDEALISAFGTAGLARLWGIDWETQGRAACAEYNRGYRTTLLED